MPYSYPMFRILYY